jgi:hypothetical protein
MKVFGSWKIVQLFVESGEATGKACLRYKQELATNSMTHIFIYTWHDAKIVIINVKNGYKSLIAC